MVPTLEWIVTRVEAAGRAALAALPGMETEVKPDAIIHMAGLQVPVCRENPVLGAKVNVLGTLNIFEAVKAER